MNKFDALEMCITLWDGIADNNIAVRQKGGFANSLFGMSLIYGCPCCEYAAQENRAAGALIDIKGMCVHGPMWPADECGVEFACENKEGATYRTWRANPCAENARAVADQARETLDAALHALKVQQRNTCVCKSEDGSALNQCHECPR